MPKTQGSNRCHAERPMTIPWAYGITSGRVSACCTCTELAWTLVAVDIDSQVGELNIDELLSDAPIQ